MAHSIARKAAKAMSCNGYGVVVLLVLMTAGCALVNDNLRVVEHEELWRSAQMSPERLAYTIEKHNIKTVISLRGVNESESWYRDEVAICEELGVTRHDLPWTMRRIPEPESLQQLMAWFETAEKPILVHCQAGIHRAGVASASYKLYKGADLETARDQFGFYFGGAPIGNVLDLYEGSEKSFADWVRTDYPVVYATRLAEAETQSRAGEDASP